MKQVDLLCSRHVAKKRDHLFEARLYDHLWRKLRINQHDVCVSRLQTRYAVVQERAARIQRTVSEHEIRSNLPKHEIGLGDNHIFLEPRYHLGRFLAVHSPIEQRNLRLRQTSGELQLKATRV